MRTDRRPVVHIRTTDSPGRYVAGFRTEFLDATYACEFSASAVGAIALHRFAEMITAQYGRPVELRIDTDLFPAGSETVARILAHIGLAESDEPIKRQESLR